MEIFTALLFLALFIFPILGLIGLLNPRILSCDSRSEVIVGTLEFMIGIIILLVMFDKDLQAIIKAIITLFIAIL